MLAEFLSLLILPIPYKSVYKKGDSLNCHPSLLIYGIPIHTSALYYLFKLINSSNKVSDVVIILEFA